MEYNFLVVLFFYDKKQALPIYCRDIITKLRPSWFKVIDVDLGSFKICSSSYGYDIIKSKVLR